MAHNHADTTSNSHAAAITHAYAAADNSNAHTNGNTDAASYANAYADVSNLAGLSHGNADTNPDAYMPALAAPYTDLNAMRTDKALLLGRWVQKYRAEIIRALWIAEEWDRTSADSARGCEWMQEAIRYANKFKNLRAYLQKPI